MAWPYTKNITWGKGEEPSEFRDQPVDANTIIYEGCPVGFNAGSTPVNCARPCSAGDVFAGFAERLADNTTATAANPNILSTPNFGDGTTGANGAKIRLRTGGLVRLYKALTPDNTGAVGVNPQGLVGTQADVGATLYYNGSGFTTTSGGNTKVGVVVQVGTSIFGGVFWDIRLPGQATRSP